MFSGTDKSPLRRHKSDLKFSMIFAAVFWLTAVILYAFVFVYIYSSLRQDSRTGIQVRMLGYWAIDQSGGLDALEENIDVNLILSGEQPFFVRVSDEFNNTLLFDAPVNWSSFEYKKLEDNPPQPGKFVQLKSPLLKYLLETGCIPLSGGKFLQVGMSDETRRRVMELLSGSFFIALLILVVLSTVIGFIVARRFLRPVHDLENAVADVIETGRIESRIVEGHGAGEMEQLVVSFNEMLSKIEDLVFGMKGALDTVAHDLRTPLTRFRMTAEKALSREPGAGMEDEYKSSLEQAVEESDTILRMMTLLMDISEAETGTLKLNKTEFSALEKVRELIDLYEFAAEDRDISLEISADAWTGNLHADPDRFRQAVGNLIDNAVKYGKPGGKVVINIIEADDLISVIVKDDGAGIAQSDLPEIWKRLYRGKSSRDGLGLGLSLVNAVVKAHGGTADVESTPGRGSVFTISFPLNSEP